MRWLALAAVLAIAVSAVAQETTARAAPRGLFALSTNIEPLPDAVYTSAVQGVSLRGGWRDFEPEEGRLVWHFDRELERAGRAGKAVMLRVAADYRTPGWVWAAGAERFELAEKSPLSRTQGQVVAIPVPWDEVFLAKWRRFIASLGERYAGDRRVVLVHMTGPSRYGSEMHLATTPHDKERWQRRGYSKRRLVEAWKAIIDAYADAFPQTALALNVSTPLLDDGVVEDVLAYGVHRVGKRFAVQHNALHARTRPGKTPHRWVTSVREEARIGFQLLVPVTPQGRFNDQGRRFGGTMAEAVSIALDAGAAYLEIYPADLRDPVSAAALADAARRLSP
jgi:hypothetical protein